VTFLNSFDFHGTVLPNTVSCTSFVEQLLSAISTDITVLLILCFDWFSSLGAFKICFAKIAVKEKFHCLIKASVYSVYFLPKEKVNYVELMFR
jgi:hypothetical protein